MILQTYTVTLVTVVTVVVLHSAKYFAEVTLNAQQMCCDFSVIHMHVMTKIYANGVMLTGMLVGLPAINL